MDRTWFAWLLGVIVMWPGMSAAERKPVRLAVMDFTAAASDPVYAPLGAGLQSMITTDLGQVGAFILVERQRMKDIEAELKLGDSALVDKETAAKIGGLAGASHLLVGSYTVVGGRMRLDARLFAVATGELVLGEKSDGAETAFFELERTLVKKIVDSVGVRLAKKEKTDLARPQTQDWEAFQKYSQGLVLFDAKKTDESIAALKAAVARDPNFQLAAQKLAEVQAWAAQHPSTPKLPEAPVCQQNPLQTPSCQTAQGAAPSTEPPRFPTLFAGDSKRATSVVVHAGGTEALCATPCQLYLPKGPVEVEVLSPTSYRKTLEAPGGPAVVEVKTRNRTNLIVGATLAAFTVAMVATTIGLHEAPYDPTASSQAQLYWPVPLSLATGAAFPAIYYLLQMGKDDAQLRAVR